MPTPHSTVRSATQSHCVTPAASRQSAGQAISDPGKAKRIGGEVRGSERIPEVTTAELAYIVEFERDRVKVGNADAFASSSLRVTSIFRREDGE
jgi:hypothetical protein